MAFYKDAGATLADLRVAVNTLEETERIARRVWQGAHPTDAGPSEPGRSRARSASTRNATGVGLFPPSYKPRYAVDDDSQI